MRSHVAIPPVAALLLAALLGAMVASPVLARSNPSGVHPSAVVHRPDGWVRYEGLWSGYDYYPDPKPWVGNNIYNTTGAYQTAKKRLVGAYSDGAYVAFAVTIQNDGASDRFKLRATGQGSIVRYFHGTTNITSAVVAGTFRTPLLGRGAKYVISVRVDVEDAVRLLTATSIADTTKKDAVKVKVTLSCGC